MWKQVADQFEDYGITLPLAVKNDIVWHEYHMMLIPDFCKTCAIINMLIKKYGVLSHKSE